MRRSSRIFLSPFSQRRRWEKVRVLACQLSTASLSRAADISPSIASWDQEPCSGCIFPKLPGSLRRFGYSILEAQDSRSVKGFVLQYGKPIHLLLTDVVMPILGGRELAAQLKIIRRDLKVLFMSGYADECMLQEGLMEPDTAYIQK